MSNDTTPASRRDVFFTIALAVAKHGLPTPQAVSLYDSHRGVDIGIENDHPAAQQWAEHLALPYDRTSPTLTRDGDRLIHTWWGQRDGWSWSVRTTTPVDFPAAAASLELAAKVVDAIEVSS